MPIFPSCPLCNAFVNEGTTFFNRDMGYSEEFIERSESERVIFRFNCPWNEESVIATLSKGWNERWITSGFRVLHLQWTANSIPTSKHEIDGNDPSQGVLISFLSESIRSYFSVIDKGETWKPVISLNGNRSCGCCLSCSLRTQSSIWRSIWTSRCESSSMAAERVCDDCVWLIRVVVGILKGYDALMNLVLDDCVEYLRGSSAPFFLTTRPWRPLFALWRVEKARHCRLQDWLYCHPESCGRNDGNSESLRRRVVSL